MKPATTGDHWFWWGAGSVCAGYVALLAGMVLADAAFVFQAPTHADADARANANADEDGVFAALAEPSLRRSIHLTLVSCGITTILSLGVAIPIGYLLSRSRFPGKAVVEGVVDGPVVLPPLAVGLSLLLLFQWLPDWLSGAVVYRAPAVILAQFVVASALAIRTMRAAYDQVDDRLERVAWTLGASRYQSFSRVVIPEVRPGIATAGAVAWARSLGEFGPLLVFAGATRGKTEVLATTVFLELSVGRLRSAAAISLLMIAAAATVLTVARRLGRRESLGSV
ncbi:MAG: ABC transporter permease [Planctomycetota bacterium]